MQTHVIVRHLSTPACLTIKLFVPPKAIIALSLANDAGAIRSVLSSVEVFYDSSHPAVYVHKRDPNAQPSSSLTPNASQVLLLGTANAVPGYSNQGSVSTGGGYWTLGPQMPASISDMSVRAHFLSILTAPLVLLAGNAAGLPIICVHL